MENEIATRVRATITVPSTNYVLLIAQFTGLTEGDSYSEFGVFDSLVGGVMFSRHLPLETPPAELTTGTTREVPSDGIVNARVRYNVTQGTY